MVAPLVVERFEHCPPSLAFERQLLLALGARVDQRHGQVVDVIEVVREHLEDAAVEHRLLATAKLLRRGVPTIEEWQSTLNRSYINQKQYDALQHIWSKFRMQTFKDWHDLYLAIDVDGLADKFEHFRNMSMRLD